MLFALVKPVHVNFLALSLSVAPSRRSIFSALASARSSCCWCVRAVRAAAGGGATCGLYAAARVAASVRVPRSPLVWAATRHRPSPKMLRVGLKFPVSCVNLNRVNKRGCETLYFTARCYQTRPTIKAVCRLFKDVTPPYRLSENRLSVQRYSTERSKESRGSSGTLVAFGIVTITALGVLTYARSDDKFRATLEGWIPGTDKTIKIIFQEEKSYFEMILNFFESLKNQIWNFIFPVESSKQKEGAPRPAFTPSALELSPPLAKSKPEVLIKDEGQNIEVVTQKPPLTNVTNVAGDLHDLEKYGGELASEAIASFKKAACAVQDYNQDVLSIVENTDTDVKPEVWDRLKSANEKRLQAIAGAEKNADKAVETLRKLHKSIDDPKLEATQGQKTIARNNISRILADVDEAKRKFDEEVSNANITDKYWKSVRAAREKFRDELEILFPNINLKEKKVSVTDEGFDLFVLHMYHKVAFLQSELEKMQTIADAKLKSALKSLGDNEKVDEAILSEVTKEKRKIQENFDLKLLEEKKQLENEMRRQLQLQAQVHADHLKEAIAAKEREADRLKSRVASEQKEKESLSQKTELAAVIGRLRGLDEALKARMDAEKNASEAQLMWGACQALVRAIKTAPPGTLPEDSVRPLEKEINALSKAAPKGDVFVDTAIKGIPEEAVKRGVYPEDALRERFLKVEQMARKLALVPEEGASLPVYLLSYLQSFLLVTAVSPIPKSELDDQPIDAAALDTYEVLQRARYWLDRGDFKMTLRYMNLLKGAPRSIARDWMNETRILLETQQAIESLVAYAGASSLMFMGSPDKKK